jgi:psiF repeat
LADGSRIRFLEERMKQVIVAACLMLAAGPYALAQDKAQDVEKKSATPKEKSEKREPTAAQKAHQVRMKDCAGKAGDRKGDERKKFMSSCLKGEDVTASSAKQVGQQNKMKSCNKDAADKKLKGDERKKFMSECLKA